MAYTKLKRLAVWSVVLCLATGLTLSSAWADEDESSDEETSQEESTEDERDPLDGPQVPDDPYLEADDEEPQIDGPRLPRANLSAPDDADPEFEAELEGYREAFERYATTIQEYQDTIQNLVQTEFDRRMAEINSFYNPQIRAAQSVEGQRRDEAIASLETFLNEYPDDADHTPDALFRLALLYDQREDDDYSLASREYFEAIREIDDPENMPPPPERSYADSQEMFTRLIEDWPDYRAVDMALYFMAHIEWEQGNADRARDAAAELLRRRPESEFVPHAWLMIGEFYFEDAERDGEEHIRDNLIMAREAFAEAGSEAGRATLTDANFIRAIYSLAWTHYRLEDYPQAIAIFKDVIESIEAAAERTGTRRDLLRDDSIKHLAEILAIEDWELDGILRDDDTVMARIHEHLSSGEAYEREVLLMLGEELARFLRFGEAIEVYEHVLATDPLHPDNPAVHARVVEGLHRDFRVEAAFAVRRNMMDYYGHDSAWYAHQQRVGNEAAIRRADNMVRDYLLMAATWYHEQAQNTRNEALVRRDAAMVSLAEEQYAIAADAYRQFLRQFPNDREIFQWNFYYAETLYYSGQYHDAFEQYQVVRELDIPDNPFQEVSAFNAITALEYMMLAEVEAGRLTSRALARNLDDAHAAADSLGQERELDEDHALQAVTIDGIPIPSMVLDYVTAMDRYVVLQLENPGDAYLGAKFAFQSARVFFNFRHNDEARTRFAWIVENFPEHEVAYLAGSMILESFRQENDYASLTEWAEILADVITGDQAEAVRAEIQQYRLIALFRSAEEYFRAEQYEEAAREFARLAREAPDHHLATRALNNAAISHERRGAYDDASHYYEELFRQHPDDPLSSRAVYRVAVNAEWLFDYEKSIRHYQLFYDEYAGPTPEDLAALEFDIEESREASLLQVARFQEFLQRYEDSARTFEEYYDTYRDYEYAPGALWSAADNWEKAGDEAAMIRVLNRYIDTFDNDISQVERTMTARLRLANLYDERGDERRARAQRDAILSQYDRWMAEGEEPPPGQASLRAMAAETKFMIVDEEFEAWDSIAIQGSQAQIGRLLQERIQGMRDLPNRYEEVMDYGNVDWNLAANFRIGNVFHRMAAAVEAIDNPFEPGSDAYFEYQDTLDDLIFPMEDAAVDAYRATINQARQREIVNEWTRRTLRELNFFEPANYPLYKEARRPHQVHLRMGVPMLSQEGYEDRLRRQEWNELEPEEVDDDGGDDS